MDTPLTLPQQRERLSRQMEIYRTVPEYILDGTGALLQWIIAPKTRTRITFLPIHASLQEADGFPSLWLNGLAIAFFTFLVGWLIAFAVGTRLRSEELRLTLWSAASGALALIANKINIRTFLDTFRASCIDKLMRSSDVENLESLLAEYFLWWKPLMAGVLVGPIFGWFLYQTWLANHQGYAFNAGAFVIILFSCIQSVWVGYYLFPFYVAFPDRLTHYHFDLYEADPSSSEIVGQLSRLLTFIMYTTIGYIVWLTFGLTYIRVLTSDNAAPAVIFSVFVWAPTVLLYAAGQFHLSNMITRAKWKILNDIQSKVEELYSHDQIPDATTLDRLGKLMDYHDRIKDTPNSALDFRAGLNFMNSLLLPVLAFIAANLKEFIGLFRAR